MIGCFGSVDGVGCSLVLGLLWLVVLDGVIGF